ncbi:P-II family nitrogen regulator [Pseudoclostridium thermosuccinogenes]|uniref:P-II family nitrogen regulator n=1 Tax=Clostridium thermosuccinogenes TaxID=84032 RepID=UPI000CCBDD62|nr:P-II family nitrogen regulator [Pseudoclostridium thermosuccinogenes]PNT92532.1 transcriptional regulator [Pseudoclostridium thermosuccinogenes]
MKQIKAIVRPEKLPDVREALEKTGCYRGVMITDIMGQGAQKGITQAWRGEKYQVDLLPKVMIDLVVKDEDVETITDTIIKSARTGDIGDGKIFVYDVVEAVRIRTGEKGNDAL